MISSSRLSVSFDNQQILKDISFTINRGEKIGLIGLNVSGKTTVLKIITHNLHPTKGRVILNPKAEIGWYQQEQEGLNDGLSVFEEVKQIRNISPQIIRNALAHFLFPNERLRQKVGTLSRGERARLALCKIMLSGSNLLLLDEPTNHLDLPSRNSLIQSLSTYKGAMLVVSHDQAFLRDIGITWSVKLPRGEIVRID